MRDFRASVREFGSVVDLQGQSSVEKRVDVPNDFEVVVKDSSVSKTNTSCKKQHHRYDFRLGSLYPSYLVACRAACGPAPSFSSLVVFSE